MKKQVILFAVMQIAFIVVVNCQLTNSLEEYYKLDETSGQAVNIASPGVNNSSSLTATRGAVGKIGDAFSFDGVSQRVDFADHTNWTITTTSSLSISVWIYLTGDIASNGYGNIWGFQDGPQFFLQRASAGNYKIGWYAGNSTPVSTNSLSFSFNTWYHLVITKNGSSVNIYRNGTNVSTLTATDIDVNPSAIYIGADSHTSYEAFKGRIDELGIWKRALTASEITQLYNSGNGLTYPFGATVPVTGISVNPTTATVAVGGTTQLASIITPSNATNQSVTWYSNNPPVATVNSTGLVTGVSAGTASINVVASENGMSAASTITVTTTTVPVTSVSVAPTSYSITAGTTVQLTPTVLPANATNKNVTWTSSNTGVATVNSSGLVTGVEVGTATITVTTVDGSYTATSAITVTTAAPIASWLLSGSNAYYLAGNVGIGTSLNLGNNKLTVNGKILAKEVEVVSQIASDYVFEPEYELMPLTELEIYLKQNKHLPGIPSALEFKSTGQNLGKMDDLLLRKIEELTLYIIKQQKIINELTIRMDKHCENK